MPLAEAYLRMEEVEDAIRKALLMFLKIPEDDPLADTRIRMSWPTYSESGSQPDWKRNEDVCFIRLTMDDSDPFGTLLEVSHEYDPETDTQKEIVEYSNRYRVFLIFYGPSSFKDADQFRITMFRDEIRAMFETLGLFPISGVQRPRRVPELVDGQWWERWDLTFSIYSGVRLEYDEDFFEEVQFPQPSADTP